MHADIDHAKLQQRYLVYYESKLGPRFSMDAWSTERQAEQDANGYRTDGMTARVLRVTVENGEPVARWVT